MNTTKAVIPDVPYIDWHDTLPGKLYEVKSADCQLDGAVVYCDNADNIICVHSFAGQSRLGLWNSPDTHKARYREYRGQVILENK